MQQQAVSVFCLILSGIYDQNLRGVETSLIGKRRGWEELNLILERKENVDGHEEYNDHEDGSGNRNRVFDFDDEDFFEGSGDIKQPNYRRNICFKKSITKIVAAYGCFSAF